VRQDGRQNPNCGLGAAAIAMTFGCISSWHRVPGLPLPPSGGRCAEATEVARLDSTQVAGRMAEAFAIRLVDALETDEPRIRIHDGRHLLG
jgi:hypothetical protein